MWIQRRIAKSVRSPEVYPLTRKLKKYILSISQMLTLQSESADASQTAYLYVSAVRMLCVCTNFVVLHQMSLNRDFFIFIYFFFNNADCKQTENASFFVTSMSASLHIQFLNHSESVNSTHHFPLWRADDLCSQKYKVFSTACNLEHA